MCKFLFQDIFELPAFKKFFKTGKEFDDNFVYEISFGFMPRLFKNTPEDRYLLEEEGDVTEIYFIMKGTWAIAYNSYLKPQEGLSYEKEEEEAETPADMHRLG